MFHVFASFYACYGGTDERARLWTQDTSTQAPSLGQEGPQEGDMPIHSSMLACKTPWTEEPGGLQSTGPQRVRHYRARTRTHTHIHTRARARAHTHSLTHTQTHTHTYTHTPPTHTHPTHTLSHTHRHTHTQTHLHTHTQTQTHTQTHTHIHTYTHTHTPPNDGKAPLQARCTALTANISESGSCTAAAPGDH